MTPINQTTFRSDLKISFLLLCILMGTIYIYWPGLNGTFMFDDYANFEILTKLDQFNTGERILQFIFSSNSGPSGRPISLLSFMLNDTAWPSQPWSFLYTNLMIHLLNCILVFLVIFKLGTLLKLTHSRSALVATITAALWAIHPLHVSTVLYVVQRMTMLSTLFTLAALSGYLYGRTILNIHPGKAYWGMSLSILIFGSLAFFSKETGALLPIYILVIEYFLLRPTGNTYPSHFRYWVGLFLWLPNLIMLGYFLISLPAISASYNIRDFTLIERLLTESRIVTEYLFHTLIPKIGNSGLFHDDYTISRSLVSPVSTIMAISFIIIMLVTAIKLRIKKPIFSFSVFWFLGGHIMESTIIPLELYFEHRNYLPILGPLFGITYSVIQYKGQLRPLTLSLFTILISLAAFFTSQNALLWGQPWYSAPVWAAEHPRSIRAQQFASAAAIIRGDHKKGRDYIIKALKSHPNEAGLLLQVLQLDCNNQTLTKSQVTSAIDKLSTAAYSHAILQTMMNVAKLSIDKKCIALTNKSTRKIILTFIKNPHYNKNAYLHAFYYWLGVLYAEDRLLDPAIKSLDIAHAHLPVIDIPLQQAAWLLSAGLYDDAQRYVDKARAIDNRVKNPFLKHTRKKDIDNMEKLIIKIRRQKQPG